MHKINKSWINFIGKEYLDTPIMNEYLQFKENDNHFKWVELIKPNKVVCIIYFRINLKIVIQFHYVEKILGNKKYFLKLLDYK